MANQFKSTIKTLIKYGQSPAEIVALFSGLNPSNSEKLQIFNLANKQYNH